MPRINITTNDVSLRSTRITVPDNYVYVPGSTITGDASKPVTILSEEEFISQFGDHSPEGSRTWEYVVGLLRSGLPVLFRRIAYIGQDTSAAVEGVGHAFTILGHRNADASDSDQVVQDVRIEERWGGTYGNNMSVSMKAQNNAYYIEVFHNSSLLEKKKLTSVDPGDLEDTVSQKLIDAFNTVTFDTITTKILNTDAATFKLRTVEKQLLSGGTDFKEELMPPEIKKSYEFIRDRFLYEPKFITSGGYTDTDISTNPEIINGIKELTRERQDCVGFIDLPYGYPKETAQITISGFTYNGTSASKLPALACTGPWQLIKMLGNREEWMPGSYIELVAIGNSISKGNPVYLAPAGVDRAVINQIIKPEYEIGSDILEQWQSNDSVGNINPIMKIKSYGYCIFGQRTLYDTGDPEMVSSLQELSAVLAINEIRRAAFNIGLSLQFSANNIFTFGRFQSQMSNKLNGMKTNEAVSDYLIQNVSTENDPRTMRIRIDVSLIPIAENFEIELNITKDNITFSDELNSSGAV